MKYLSKFENVMACMTIAALLVAPFSSGITVVDLAQICMLCLIIHALWFPDK